MQTAKRPKCKDMLLNKEIQMQRPNKLHNKTQQPVEDKIQLHKDPTHCIIRSNQLCTLLKTTNYVHTPKSRWRFAKDPYTRRHHQAQAIMNSCTSLYTRPHLIRSGHTKHINSMSRLLGCNLFCLFFGSAFFSAPQSGPFCRHGCTQAYHS